MDIIEPGCLILRGYDYYLDGKFVPSTRSYSHLGIYVGDNTVIHAVSKGVSEVNLIDFCECDRICVIKPRAYRKNAIKRAYKYMEDSTGYDFFFDGDNTEQYCFELGANCYPRLDIEKVEKKTLFGLIKKNVYLADSFFNSKDMEIIFEYNPKCKIDFIRQ